jgi:peroxiredoxin
VADRRSPDAFGFLAYLLYVGVGGLLVFGFAWSLRGAVEVQKDSVCRAMRPEGREGPAPDFTVQDLAGNPVSLQDYRGKFVVLNFWATWCEPCIGEWPQLHKLAERLADRDDVVVLAISMDQKPEDLAPFLERMSLSETPVQVLWDPEQNVQKTFGTEQLPDTYFIDGDGELVHAYINERKWGAPEGYHCVDGMIRQRS